ncbi:DUF3047 domain-containing protein [Nitrogeniibacter mangrovi]|uniref:DUF3047 domain-containing protein n=1 Tax=Nitrogeniibacter mangrovi TaxID=2016596 RepID=A0A6C1B4A6_9RHOO|nr:DUF3047 domain-containing protein [Nitrogeniibacter mangrovi]QID18263.1 DUF3047 domain-containing protein [Nitrogeniibacter mangrovi]
MIRPLILLLTGLLVALPASATMSQPPAVADAPPGPPPSGWVHTQINEDTTPTRFSVVRDHGEGVIQARSEAGASSLVHTLSAPVPASAQLRWRWKVSNAVPGSDMAHKATDDYAARVYVFFDLSRDKLSLVDRIKIDAARTLWGAELPTAALCYVWGTKNAIGSIGPNPYTDRVRMIVLERGNARSGQWVMEQRDLAADFKAAFGEDAPPVTGIALGADTDNTGAEVEARFADIRFEAPAQ